MTVGFRNAANVDFDLLFDPYVIGTKPADCGLRDIGGVDLVNRYAPIIYGTKGPDVGFYLPDGTDVSNLWAAFGTATYTIAGLNGKFLEAVDQALTDQPAVFASVQVILRETGGWEVLGATSFGPTVPSGPPTSGAWVPSGGTPSDYEVQMIVTSGGSADRVNDTNAATYQPLTAARYASLTLPAIAANNSIQRTASGTFEIRLRRIGSTSPSVTMVSASIGTNGYL